MHSHICRCLMIKLCKKMLCETLATTVQPRKCPKTATGQTGRIKFCYVSRKKNFANNFINLILFIIAPVDHMFVATTYSCQDRYFAKSCENNMAVTNIIKTKLWLKVLLNKYLKSVLNVHIFFHFLNFWFYWYWALSSGYGIQWWTNVMCKL